jgi:chromosome segregation ATPase
MLMGNDIIEVQMETAIQELTALVRQNHLETRESIAEIGRDLALVKTDVAEMGRDLALVKTDVAEMGRDLALVKTDVAEMGRDLALVKADMAEMGRDLTLVKADVTMLKMDVGIIKSDVASLKTSLADTSARVTASEGRVFTFFMGVMAIFGAITSGAVFKLLDFTKLPN